MSDDLSGLPVHGYRPQTASAVSLVNEHKEIEERLLRRLDAMKDEGFRFDQRWLAIARTDLERGFMALNRAVFRPDRVQLADDDAP